MKKLPLLLAVLICASSTHAKGKSSGSRKPPGEHHVNGYYRKDGTYVHPYTAGHGPLADKSSSGGYGSYTPGDAAPGTPDDLPTPAPPSISDSLKKSGTWLPHPPQVYSPPAIVIGNQDDYLKRARVLATEAQIQHFQVEQGAHSWRASCELWAQAVALGDDATKDSRFMDSNPDSVKMQQAQKDILNNLLVLEKLGGMISSLNPVPTSCVDIDECFQRYSQLVLGGTENIREGINANNANQISEGEDQLSDGLRFLNEATDLIKAHGDGTPNPKTYVPG